MTGSPDTLRETARHSLMFTRPGWTSIPLAEIRLADHGGRWFSSFCFTQDGGDFWGVGEPLVPVMPYPSMQAALTAAIDRMRAMLSARPVEMAKQLAWLSTLTAAPETQPDLFGDYRHAS